VTVLVLCPAGQNHQLSLWFLVCYIVGSVPCERQISCTKNIFCYHIADGGIGGVRGRLYESLPEPTACTLQWNKLGYDGLGA
jgi:hypothetical protein